MNHTLRTACKSAATATLPVQVSNASVGNTSGGRPFLTVQLTDHSGSWDTKIWSDNESFEELAKGEGFYHLTAEFSLNEFGLSLKKPAFAPMPESQVAEFLAGGEDQLARQKEEFALIESAIASISNKALRVATQSVFLSPQLQRRFLRAGAAIKNHHAHRGGLLQHTASMLRIADMIGPHYAADMDTLRAGVLLHDIGKVLECDTGDGLAPKPELRGEMLGHILAGVEIFNSSWKQASTEDTAEFKNSEPVRLRVIHLIASHHGSLEFGSPVTPKTLEAHLLHHIDNMDAKAQMVVEAVEENRPSPVSCMIDGGRILGRILPP